VGSPERNLQRLQPLIERLTEAVSAGDATEFERLIEDLVHARRKELFAQLRQLTGQVRRALDAFQSDARLASLAEKEVPDARARLQHVLALTDDAAHRTMDLVEGCAPLVDQLAAVAARSGAGGEAQVLCAQLRRHLSDVLLAQGYQDLSGQIIRNVIALVGEVELALVGLSQIVVDGAAPRANGAVQAQGYGPIVPGVDHGPAVASQQDVDALLSGLGL
jgi:chemotaxis protein CheZ